MIGNLDALADSILRKHPGVNWHHLPDLESAPDVYIVSGQYQQPGRTYPTDFEISEEYTTWEAAQRQVEHLRRTSPGQDTCWMSVRITAAKPAALVELHTAKAILEESGKLPLPR